MMSAWHGHISDSPTLKLYMWALCLLCPVLNRNRISCSGLFSLWRLHDDGGDGHDDGSYANDGGGNCDKNVDDDDIEGSRPEWCISSMIYSRDIPFYLGTMDMLIRLANLITTFYPSSHCQGGVDKDGSNADDGDS